MLRISGRITDLIQTQVIEGIRWLLLNHPENLDDKRNERALLALRSNEPLVCTNTTSKSISTDLESGSQGYRRICPEGYSLPRRQESESVKKFAQTLEYRAGILA